MEKHNHYPAFDYLRIVLASVVMFGHDKIITLPNAGKLAVDVFFALSGWLIGGILMRSSAQDIKRFFFNRSIRVWTPYYFALFLILLASLAKDPIDSKWMEFVVYKITFVYNIFGTPQLANHMQDMPLNGTANHMWSVNAEEQFYLMAPLVLCLFQSGKKIALWIAISIAALYSNIYPSIVLGVTAAAIAHQKPEFHLSIFAKLTLVGALTASAWSLWQHGYNPSAHIFSISLVLLLAYTGAKSKVGGFLGGISYQLYLNHWIGVFFFNFALRPFNLADSPLRQALACALNYAVAAALYKIMDERLLANRAKWYSEKKSTIILAAAYALPILGTTYALTLQR